MCYHLPFFPKEAIIMNLKTTLSTKRLVMAALMAALTVVGSGIRIKVPASIVGTSAFHLGNIMCALSGILLGPWLGGAAAGIGSAIFDIMNPDYIPECWLTFLMKGAYGVAAGLIAGKRWGYGKALAGSAVGALTYAALYLLKTYFYTGLFEYGLTPDAAWLNVLGKLLPTGFNAAVAIVAAPLLAITIRKALAKNHLRLE
jgi:uncharacterized membrane protein